MCVKRGVYLKKKKITFPQTFSKKQRGCVTAGVTVPMMPPCEGVREEVSVIERLPHLKTFSSSMKLGSVITFFLYQRIYPKF